MIDINNITTQNLAREWIRTEQWVQLLLELSKDFESAIEWGRFNTQLDSQYGFVVEFPDMKIIITDQQKFTFFTIMWGHRLSDPAVDI